MREPTSARANHRVKGWGIASSFRTNRQ
jgi:hypothetical protein